MEWGCDQWQLSPPVSNLRIRPCGLNSEALASALAKPLAQKQLDPSAALHPYLRQVSPFLGMERAPTAAPVGWLPWDACLLLRSWAVGQHCIGLFVGNSCAFPRTSSHRKCLNLQRLKYLLEAVPRAHAFLKAKSSDIKTQTLPSLRYMGQHRISQLWKLGGFFFLHAQGHDSKFIVLEKNASG